MVSPYQIRLDEDGKLIHAPFDEDDCVKKYVEEKDADATGPPLRFKIGERVLACVHHIWLPGVIVDTYYR